MRVGGACRNLLLLLLPGSVACEDAAAPAPGAAGRSVTSLTATLTPAKYQRACARLTELRRELLDLASEPDEPGERPEVHQVVFAVFPITKEPQR